MTSERKRAANRRNAKRSTGPRSAAGKANSRNNALRHGLARKHTRLIGQIGEIDQLALAFAGSDPSLEMLYYARAAAEAELDVLRIRTVRADFISQKAADPATFAPQRLLPDNRIDKLRKVVESGPDEIFHDSRAALANTLRIAMEYNEYQLNRPSPNDEDKPAVAFGRHYREISRYDRYEQRALSRRRKALRALVQMRKWGGANYS
jgi:hypothetical protein